LPEEKKEVFHSFFALLCDCCLLHSFSGYRENFLGIFFYGVPKKRAAEKTDTADTAGGKITPAEPPSSACELPGDPKWEKPPNQLHKTLKKSTVSLLHFPYRMCYHYTEQFCGVNVFTY